jgi:hypothetical protein
MFQLSFDDQRGQRSKELVKMQQQQQQQQERRQRTLLCDQQQLAALASVGCRSNTCERLLCCAWCRDWLLALCPLPMHMQPALSAVTWGHACLLA